ncbi:deoxyribose-phosphate aldolase [Candidatus Acetothermia bacterium]|nr:deoxyribose-phosphate aldolase [Candidatus Acetothermia bacterium]MBI3459763.1 deoxyribose-phosphate aldolase [Candidatus Acetothermia bacterium]MBI3659905.1 deoxyribose-phosphate aldolase [Candidatus Acetothermia bacterium]
MKRAELAVMIDHTKLGPDVSKEQIHQLCTEAKRFQFISVCLNPCYVAFAQEELRGSSVRVCTVIGFPHGANVTPIKVAEAEQALKEGTDELDMVINIPALKANETQCVQSEIEAICRVAKQGPKRALVKVIIETCLLNDEQKRLACTLSKNAGADFVKTSTGFSTSGATLEDVKLMRAAVGPKMGVKASGGIRDLATALKMIEAGATRIGTSSGVKMIEEIPM